jgi:hypothetical protein
LFGEVCARDYGEYGYPDVHRLVVDAYMAQHPGFATAAGRRSVVVHLVGLCLTLELGARRDEVARALGRVFPSKPDVPALEYRAPLGELTIASVADARDRDEHVRITHEWARSVWAAWSMHHPHIRHLAHSAAR